MHVRSFIVLAAVAALGIVSCASDEDDAVTATLTSPADGASLSGGVAVAMAAEGVTIEPAGEVHDGAGHFHVIADAGCVETGAGIGKDADHLHFGKAQADGVIYLEPGEHELCLQVGDGAHTALDITDSVTVDVGVRSSDDFCAVVGEIDELFESVDNSSDDFATKQIGYENIRRLAEQAKQGVDQIEASARNDVAATVTFAGDLAAALASAESPQAAEAAVAPIFEAVPDGLPGAEWVLDTCGIDIDG